MLLNYTCGYDLGVDSTLRTRERNILFNYTYFFFRCHECEFVLYCNNTCRKKAWYEYHQWECEGVRTHSLMVNTYAYLALRLMFCGALCNFSTSSPDEDNRHGFQENNYRFIYKLVDNFKKQSKGELSEGLMVRLCLHIICSTCSFNIIMTYLKNMIFFKFNC